MRLLPIALLVLCTGCGDTALPSRGGYDNEPSHNVHIPDRIEIHKPEIPSQRFLTTNTGDIAYDTKTGSLCKTWRWGIDGSSSQTPAMAYELPVCSGITAAEQDQESKTQQLRDRADEVKWYREHPGQKRVE